MRCSPSRACAARTPVGKASNATTAPISAPGRKRTSMRLSRPPQPSNACAPAISITASGGPSIATKPAIRSETCLPANGKRNSVGALPAGSSTAADCLNKRSAAGLRNTASGAIRLRRSAWLGWGINAGVMGAAASASKPMRRKPTRAPLACASSMSHSMTGLAQATSGCRATRGYSASSNPSRCARSVKSGSPFI